MNHSDKSAFKELLDGVSDYYQKPKLSKMALQIYFGALDRFTIEDVTRATSAHVQDTASGSFYPKAADLIEYLEGGEIKADDIVAAARLADSPLGILSRIHIGSHDLSNLNAFDLRQRAAECLQLLPGWKARAQDGEYTNHEISIMVKHGVNPAQPFSMGLASPQNAQALISRVDEVSRTDRHKELLDTPYSVESANSEPVSEDGIKRIKQELKGL